MQALQYARGQLDAARVKASQAEGQLHDAMEQLNKASGALDEARSALDQVKLPLPGIDDPGARHYLAALTELQAVFSEVVARAISKTAREELRRDQERLETQIAENKRRSEELAKKLEEARQRERTMGCIGKVIGWVVTAVSIVAAPFTGGASIALAALALAMSVAEEASGVNVLGEAMKPLMEHVLKPLVEAISKAVGDMFEKMGVRDAKKIGQAIGAVIGAAIMVVVVMAALLVGRAAAAKLVPKIIDVAGKLFGRLANDLTKASVALGNKMAKDSLKSLGSGLSSMTGISAKNAASAVLHARPHAVRGETFARKGNELVVGDKTDLDIPRIGRYFQDPPLDGFVCDRLAAVLTKHQHRMRGIVEAKDHHRNVCAHQRTFDALALAIQTKPLDALVIRFVAALATRRSDVARLRNQRIATTVAPLNLLKGLAHLLQPG